MRPAFVALCAAAVAGALGFALGRRGGPDAVDVAFRLPCDGAVDANADLARALAATAGRTLEIPAGCRLRLAPGGATTAAVEIPSGTRIHCQGPTAEFVLARRACGGDTPTPGAACRTAHDCAGAAPTCEGAGGPTFDEPVHVADVTLAATVFRAAPASHDVALEGCTVRVGQRDVYGRCDGGDSPGRACAPNAPCDGGGCSAAPDGTADLVNVVDLSSSVPARIERVTVVDHRRGDAAFRVGNSATVTGNDTTRFTTGNADDGYGRVDVRIGIAADSGSIVAHNHVRAAGRGIAVAGPLTAHVTGNQVDVTAARAGAEPATGIHAESAFGITDGNIVRCSPDTPSANAGSSATGIVVGQALQQSVHHNMIVACYRGIEVDPRAGNVTIDHNRVLFGAGAKLVLSQFGNTVTGNYLAWGTGNLDVVPPGATCRGLGRRPCRSDADCGDAGSCRPEPIVWVGQDGEIGTAGSQHDVIDAGNLLSSERADVVGIRLADTGARCARGRRAGRHCTTNGDCGEGSCLPGRHENLTIRGNTFVVTGAGAVGVDLGELASGTTTVAGLLIADNFFAAGGRDTYDAAVHMPPRGEAARGVVLSNNHGAFTRLTDRWDWESGLRTGNQPTLEGDAFGLLSFRNADVVALASGDPVEVMIGGNGGIRHAATAATTIGVLLRACDPGDPCLLATGGTATCRLATNAATIVGAGLTADARGFMPVAAGTAPVAIALAASTAPGVVPCLWQRR